MKRPNQAKIDDLLSQWSSRVDVMMLNGLLDTAPECAPVEAQCCEIHYGNVLMLDTRLLQVANETVGQYKPAFNRWIHLASLATDWAEMGRDS
jgi:hypothetical protein